MVQNLLTDHNVMKKSFNIDSFGHKELWQYLQRLNLLIIALLAAKPTYRGLPRRPFAKHIAVGGQRGQAEPVLLLPAPPSPLLLGEVGRRRPRRDLQPHGRLHDDPHLLLPRRGPRGRGGGREVDEAGGVEEGEDLPEERDVPDERPADLGEGEPARRVLPVLGDDEVAVLAVDPRVPRRRPEPGAAGPAEELRQRAALRLVDPVPPEPTCGG